MDYFGGGVLPKNFDINQRVNWLSQSFVPIEKASALKDKIDQIDGVKCVMVVAQKPGCCDMHVVNSEATKEHAIAELLSRIEVSREHVVGIGDGHNDLHLFNAVGTKVAMGNAVAELKRMADVVIGSVKECGLAEYLEGLV